MQISKNPEARAKNRVEFWIEVFYNDGGSFWRAAGPEDLRPAGRCIITEREHVKEHYF